MSGSQHYESKAVAELATAEEYKPTLNIEYHLARAGVFALLAVSAAVRDAKR